MWYKGGGGGVKMAKYRGNVLVHIFYILYNQIFCFRLLRLSVTAVRMSRTVDIYIYFKCFTDPGLLKIRHISTPYRCGLTTLEALAKMATIFFILLKIRNWRKTVVIEQIVIIKHCCFLLTFCVFLPKKMKNAFLFTNHLTIWYL